MNKKVDAVTFLELLPSSISGDAKIVAAAEALEVELQNINAITELVLILSRVDVLPEEVLDYLAWQLHIDNWRSDTPIARKRLLVDGAILYHKTKGTVWAIKEACRGEGYSDIVFDKSMGTWAQFSIDLLVGQGAGYATDLMKSINDAKSQRSELVALILRSQPEVELGFGIVTKSCIES